MIDWGNLFFRWLHVLSAASWAGTAVYLAKERINAPKWLRHAVATAWVSGAALLVLPYYWFPETAMRTVDQRSMAVMAGVAAVVLVWPLYDLLCRMRLPALLVASALVSGAALGLVQVQNYKAVLVHVGALLGSILAGDALFRNNDRRSLLLLIPASAFMLASHFPEPARATQDHHHHHHQAMTAPATFAQVRDILDRRCAGCHSQQRTIPGYESPAGGVVLDTPQMVRGHAQRIKVRAVEQRTMPLVNMTGMTDEERDTLGRWVDAGAQID